MLGKKIQKKICLLVTIIVLFGTSQSIYASTEEYSVGDIVDGSILTNDEIAESTIYNPLRGNILNKGVARLTNKGNRVVNVYGAVFGSVVCDKLILEMTLQRLQNGSWVDVKYYSDTAYNDSLLTNSYNTSVAGGYYYRIKAACVAQKGGSSESQLPITNGLWID